MQASGLAALLVDDACRQATHLVTRMPTGVRVGEGSRVARAAKQVIAGQYELRRDTLVGDMRAQNATVSCDESTCGRCGGLLTPGMFQERGESC